MLNKYNGTPKYKQTSSNFHLKILKKFKKWEISTSQAMFKNLSQIGRAMFGDANIAKSPMKYSPSDPQLLGQESRNPSLNLLWTNFWDVFMWISIG